MCKTNEFEFALKYNWTTHIVCNHFCLINMFGKCIWILSTLLLLCLDKHAYHIIKFYVPFKFNLPCTISVHETANSVFSTLDDTMQRKLQQMVFEAAFYGYTNALEMLLSQFWVPVNSKDQRVSGWTVSVCSLLHRLLLYSKLLSFWLGRGLQI